MSSYVVGFAIITPTMSSVKSVKFPHDASAEVFILLVPGIISCFVSIAKESLNCSVYGEALEHLWDNVRRNKLI